MNGMQELKEFLMNLDHNFRDVGNGSFLTDCPLCEKESLCLNEDKHVFICYICFRSGRDIDDFNDEYDAAHKIKNLLSLKERSYETDKYLVELLQSEIKKDDIRKKEKSDFKKEALKHISSEMDTQYYKESRSVFNKEIKELLGE